MLMVLCGEFPFIFFEGAICLDLMIIVVGFGVKCAVLSETMR